jgi:chloramphenicol-sensitive protein RarD
VSSTRRGYLMGIAAYLGWGVFPLYFKLLEPASPYEILAHRIIWSAVFMALLLAVLRRYRFLRQLARQPRRMAGVGLAAVLIGLNWFGFIYGVTSDRLVEISLGYFVNPLVSVLLGVFVLRESLRPLQWAAVGVGAVAVVVQALAYGDVPWLALLVAFSFGLYGLVKKQLGLPATEGMFIESAALLPPAIAYVVFLAGSGAAAVGNVSTAHTFFIVFSGVMTVLPLMSFADAANRIPLSALGTLQYIAPVMQFATGVLVFHEPMSAARFAAFGLVWLALAIFTWDGLRTSASARADRRRRISAAQRPRTARTITHASTATSSAPSP